MVEAVHLYINTDLRRHIQYACTVCNLATATTVLGWTLGSKESMRVEPSVSDAVIGELITWAEFPVGGYADECSTHFSGAVETIEMVRLY